MAEQRATRVGRSHTMAMLLRVDAIRELQVVEDRHDDYVERIVRLRDSILHELDALIARGSDD